MNIASSKVYVKAHRIIVDWQQLKITFVSFNKTPLCHLTKHSFCLLAWGIYASCWNNIYQPEQRNTMKLLLKHVITFILKEGWNWIIQNQMQKLMYLGGTDKAENELKINWVSWVKVDKGSILTSSFSSSSASLSSIASASAARSSASSSKSSLDNSQPWYLKGSEKVNFFFLLFHSFHLAISKYILFIHKSKYTHGSKSSHFYIPFLLLKEQMFFPDVWNKRMRLLQK